MTLRIPAKVLIHVWSYDLYDMTLSTGKQRRHMIKSDTKGDTFFGILQNIYCDIMSVRGEHGGVVVEHRSLA